MQKQYLPFTLFIVCNVKCRNFGVFTSLPNLLVHCVSLLTKWHTCVRCVGCVSVHPAHGHSVLRMCPRCVRGVEPSVWRRLDTGHWTHRTPVSALSHLHLHRLQGRILGKCRVSIYRNISGHHKERTTGCPISQSSLCFCYFLGFWSKYRQTSDSHWKAHKILISKLTLLSFLREKLTKLRHKT